MSVSPETLTERAEWRRIVGQQIMLRREERGFSQHRLANLVGCDSAKISRYESGHLSPSAHTLFKIARALSCSMDFFYGPIKRENLVKF